MRWTRGSSSEAVSLLPLRIVTPLEEVLYPLVVDGKGRVKVKLNWYSAPLPGRVLVQPVTDLGDALTPENSGAAEAAGARPSGFPRPRGQLAGLDQYARPQFWQ